MAGLVEQDRTLAATAARLKGKVAVIAVSQDLDGSKVASFLSGKKKSASVAGLPSSVVKPSVGAASPLWLRSTAPAGLGARCRRWPPPPHG
jgi:prolyl-tRNA editing enzyme YbaK/EbsC (Cys-tRNA(Pro) deacylase)